MPRRPTLSNELITGALSSLITYLDNLEPQQEFLQQFIPLLSLLYLAEHRGIRLGTTEIERLLRLQKQSLNSISAAIKAGLVVTEQAQRDRRVFHIRLSDEGRSVIEKHAAAVVLRVRLSAARLDYNFRGARTLLRENLPLLRPTTAHDSPRSTADHDEVSLLSVYPELLSVTDLAPDAATTIYGTLDNRDELSWHLDSVRHIEAAIAAANAPSPVREAYPDFHSAIAAWPLQSLPEILQRGSTRIRRGEPPAE